MAKVRWGKVYLHDRYVGRLQEEPGGRCRFTYDVSYLEAGAPPVAFTLPLRKSPYISERGLPPFFDNLVAEGWLQNAQARALGVDPNNRFALLLGFGIDLIGAISIVDPEPDPRVPMSHDSDGATLAALRGHASLSGVQRKLLMLQEGTAYRPVGEDELSTHIAKLVSGNLTDVIEVEHLSTLAVAQLLPNDAVVDTHIVSLPDINETALMIPRFDRTRSGKRIHFEEFNQLLGHYSGDDKYRGSYEQMGQFVSHTHGCMPAEAGKLFRRLLANLLIGNTDAHFKNFAMFHTQDGLRLTPLYDVVSSAHYVNYRSIALQITGANNLDLHKLEPKHILGLGRGFDLADEFVLAVIAELGERLPYTLQVMEKSAAGSRKLRDELVSKTEKRWNNSFKSIGQLWSKRQSRGARDKK
ncbi:MAG: HipA domain-containing protein [Deltaproteobacteria bacterium]|nr:HipA domain-containing protein [Deltaproteobacteria bacterium]